MIKIASDGQWMLAKSAAEKLGPEGLNAFARLVSQDGSNWLYGDSRDNWEEELHPDTTYAKLHKKLRLIQELLRKA